MTDKELRKLSRLELLELLLNVSNENEKLKENIRVLNEENNTTDNIENLLTLTRQVESTLKYANHLTEALTLSGNTYKASDGVKSEASIGSGILPDSEIYRHMMCFLIKNDEKISVFPQDIQREIRARIESLKSKKIQTNNNSRS